MVEIYQQMLNGARAFFMGGKRCLNPVQIAHNQIEFLAAPGIVCFAFSIELYLKLLNVLSGLPPPKGHDLEKLFSTLPEKTRKALIVKYGSGLEADLLAVSPAFVDWRYFYEKTYGLNISPQMLEKIADCCNQLALEIKPELRV